MITFTLRGWNLYCIRLAADEEQGSGGQTGNAPKPSINADAASEEGKATAQHTGETSAGGEATAKDARAGLADTGEHATQMEGTPASEQARAAGD